MKIWKLFLVWPLKLDFILSNNIKYNKWKFLNNIFELTAKKNIGTKEIYHKNWKKFQYI